MRSLSRTLAAVVAVALTACSGGHSSSPVPATPNQNTLAPAQTAPSKQLAYGQSALVGASFVGPAKLGTVDFGVLVKMQDPTGLVRYAQEVNDPHSGSYHQFLNPDQIADRFGASKADYEAVRSFFASKGLATMGWRQRELIRVAGSQAAVERALGANFGIFTKNNRQFRALRTAPSTLGALPIAAIMGAANYGQLVKNPVRLAASPGNAVSGYSAQQLARAFDYNGAYNAGFTGKGINIGIIGTGPILAADFANYRSTFHLAGSSTIQQVNVTDSGASTAQVQYPAGSFTTPPPTTDSCNVDPNTGPSATCNPEDGEAQVDTQQSASLARDANVLFYLAYAPDAAGPGIAGEGIQLTTYEVQQAINDNKADILSLSYGIGEQDDVGQEFNLGSDGKVDPANSEAPIQFATLAAMGIAVFASTGDTGALECLRDAGPSGPSPYVDSLCVSYPATDPNVTAIGGVNAPLADDGHLLGPITGWGAQTGGFQVFSATGGGISKYFPLPAYQAGAVGVVGATRNTPDISLLGDTATGAAAFLNFGFSDALIAGFGGTSVAAPEAAAMWALVLQACQMNATTCKAHPGTGGVSYRLGNPNPLLYPLYANPAQYQSTFTDVQFGDNSQLPGCTAPGITGATPCPNASPTPVAGYQAGLGYDLVTGIGVPSGRALIKAVVGI